MEKSICGLVCLKFYSAREVCDLVEGGVGGYCSHECDGIVIWDDAAAYVSRLSPEEDPDGVVHMIEWLAGYLQAGWGIEGTKEGGDAWLQHFCFDRTGPALRTAYWSSDSILEGICVVLRTTRLYKVNQSQPTSCFANILQNRARDVSELYDPDWT
jgi:hypothetical protein